MKRAKGTEALPSDADNREKGRKGSRIVYIVVAIVLALCVAWTIVWRTRFEMVYVDGKSMNQTLQDGQWLLLDKQREAQRGDVIVVDVRGYSEYDAAAEHNGEPRVEFIIKRLIAVEGDKVRCTDGKLEIFNAETGYTWQEVDESGYVYYSNPDERDFGPYELKTGEIFFLGDNRNNSMDSRYKEGLSRLSNRLYKAEDVYGVVTSWAIEHSEPLQNVFVDAPQAVYGFFGNIGKLFG